MAGGKICASFRALVEEAQIAFALGSNRVAVNRHPAAGPPEFAHVIAFDQYIGNPGGI